SLPSRLTLFMVMLTYRLVQLRYIKSWFILLLDANKHPSPDSGWGEAAVAALLGIRLGGSNYYQGQKSYRMEMGDPINSLHLAYIGESIKIMKRTVILFLSILVLGGITFEFTITWI